MLTHAGRKESEGIAEGAKQAAANIQAFLTAELPRDLHCDAGAVPLVLGDVKKLRQSNEAVAATANPEEFDPK